MQSNVSRRPHNHQWTEATVDANRRTIDSTQGVNVWYPVANKSRRRLWPFLLAIFAFLFFGLAMFMGFATAWWLKGDVIMPGVRVFRVDVGGLSLDEMQGQLETLWQRPLILLDSEEQTWVASPQALGFVLDIEATTGQARIIGRTFDSLEGWLESKGQVDVGPVYSLDVVTTEAFLLAIAAQTNKSAVDAGLVIRNGRAEMTPALEGQALNIKATLSQIERNPEIILDESRLLLVIDPLYPDIVDASDAVKSANEMLSTVYTIETFDPVAGQVSANEVLPEAWLGWLTLEINEDGQPEWLVEKSHLKTFLDETSNSLGPGRYLKTSEAVSAIEQAIANGETDFPLRIYYSERQHVVQQGETLTSIGRQYGMPYPWIQQANPGLEDHLYSGQTLVIPSPDQLLPLPVIDNKRIVVSISEQKTRVYEDGNLKWEWLASTGINDSPTSPGIFQIQSHEPNAYAGNWDLWMPNFLGVYRPVPGSEFMNGFHGFPTRSGYNLLWTGDLGRRVTYGCILLSTENASTLYDWAEDGVIVEVQI